MLYKTILCQRIFFSLVTEISHSDKNICREAFCGISMKLRVRVHFPKLTISGNNRSFVELETHVIQNYKKITTYVIINYLPQIKH